MTKENAQELAQRVRQRGYIVEPPLIEDAVLEALMRKSLENQEASRLQKPHVAETLSKNLSES